MEYTRKTNLTKRQLKQSLIYLLNKKNFEKITVNDIVDNALITRSTFYRYYEDKYELLSEIEDDLIEFIKEDRKIILKTTDKAQIFSKEIIKKLFLSLENHRETMKGLLTNSGVLSFEAKLKKIVADQISFIYKDTQQSNVKVVLSKEYLISIILTTFRYWATHGSEGILDDLIQLLIDVYLFGMIKAVGIDQYDYNHINSLK